MCNMFSQEHARAFIALHYGAISHHTQAGGSRAGNEAFGTNGLFMLCPLVPIRSTAHSLTHVILWMMCMFCCVYIYILYMHRIFATCAQMHRFVVIRTHTHTHVSGKSIITRIPRHRSACRSCAHERVLSVCELHSPLTRQLVECQVVIVHGVCVVRARVYIWYQNIPRAQSRLTTYNAYAHTCDAHSHTDQQPRARARVNKRHSIALVTQTSPARRRQDRVKLSRSCARSRMIT